MKLKRKYSHDELFRWVFGDPKRGRELIQTIIPAPVLACLDLETLRVEDSTYVDESLSRHFSDLVFTVGSHIYKIHHRRVARHGKGGCDGSPGKTAS